MQLLEEAAPAALSPKKVQASATPATAATMSGKKRKLDPFYRERKIAEQRKAERDAERAELRELQEGQQKAREVYYEQRKRVRAKLSKRTKTGQPVLGKHIEVLLDKIKRDSPAK